MLVTWREFLVFVVITLCVLGVCGVVLALQTR